MVIDMNYWGKVLKKIIIFLICILAVYLGFKLAIFYMPFLIAFIISLLLEPIIRIIMKKTNLKRKTSSIIVFLIAIAIIVGFFAWALTTLISETTNLLGNINFYIDKGYSTVQNIISKIDFSSIQIPENVMTILQDSAGNFLEKLSEWAQNALTGAISFLTSIPTIGIYVVVTILSLYFICVDKIYMIDQLEHHLPRTWVKKIGIHLKDLIKVLGGYLKAQATLVLITFIISLIGLYILYFIKFNVPYPLTMALIIAFLDALPIFGSGTLLVPWAVIGAFNGDIRLAVALLILWLIISIVKQVIEPRIISGNIGVHPIFTLIAMYTGFKFFGIIGMIFGPIVFIVLKNIFATFIDKGVVKSIVER